VQVQRWKKKERRGIVFVCEVCEDFKVESSRSDFDAVYVVDLEA